MVVQNVLLIHRFPSFFGEISWIFQLSMVMVLIRLPKKVVMELALLAININAVAKPWLSQPKKIIGLELKGTIFNWDAGLAQKSIVNRYLIVFCQPNIKENLWSRQQTLRVVNVYLNRSIYSLSFGCRTNFCLAIKI